MRLVLVGAKWRESVDPFLGRPPVVELAFLGFGGLPDLQLHQRVGHRDESPGLLVRAARRRACRSDRSLDQVAWYRLAREVPRGPPPIHLLEESLGALARLLERPPREHQWYERERFGGELGFGGIAHCHLGSANATYA